MLTYFLVNSLAVAAAFALANRRPIFARLARQLPVEHHELRGRRRWPPAWRSKCSQRTGHWQTPLAFVPLCSRIAPTASTSSRIADEQRRVAEWTQLHRESTEVLARAIQAKDGAGSAHVERVQYYAAMLARRLQLSELRHAGGRDGGAAARHRQAGGARAHPVEARSADRRRTAQDADSRAGRRGDRRRGAVPAARSRR